MGDDVSAPESASSVRLSVIIACLNAEDTLAEQLEALAGESCPVGWELLICDNGSTDTTVQVAERYRGRLPLRIIDASARRGAGAARNCGAQVAHGAWLAFCDADDVVGSGWLAAMAQALEAHPFVAGRFEAERLNSRGARRSRPLDQQQGLQHSPTGAGLPHAGAGNMGIHRDLFWRLNGFDQTMATLEDTDLSWRVQATGVPLVYWPAAVMHVRLRASLRQMYHQGWSYGRAHALLEQRYAELQVQPPSGRLSARPSLSIGARCVRLLRQVRRAGSLSLGRLIWQLGWHRGHRLPVDASASPTSITSR